MHREGDSFGVVAGESCTVDFREKIGRLRFLLIFQGANS